MMSETDKLEEAVNSSTEASDRELPAQEHEDLLDLYTQSLQEITEGEIVRGTVLEIRNDMVLIDIGYKSEGAIPIKEFQAPSGELTVKVGDTVDVYLEQKEDSDGLIVLSREKAEKTKIWDDIRRAYEKGDVINGMILGRTKGGLTVDIGVRAFLPGSQVDLRPVRDLDKLIGKSFPMKVIKLNQRRGNIVLSRRELLEEERRTLKERTLQSLEEGKIIRGKVKNITEYGAFIDLGGLDGLLHITDMSWGRVGHPSELFTVGDEIEVVVLKFDRAAERVSLGHKQRLKDPWEDVDQRFAIGSRVRGKVISLTDYGAFVELADGIEGLVHISEMSWTQRVKHPSKVVSVGDSIEVVVLDVDKVNKRISLGLRQIEPNPWLSIEESYPVGMRVEGTVRNLTDFGAFVELNDGIDGLIHVSDMSWTKRVRHPSEVLKRGDKVEAVVLHTDKANRRISLGLKQSQPDPWQSTVLDKYRVGMDVKAKVVRLTDFGAFVELEDGVEGLLHISELSHERVAKPEDVVSIDQELSLKIIKLDANERKLGLSLRAYLDSQEASDQQIDQEVAPQQPVEHQEEGVEAQ
ncbi:MAG: 30S ribosomal protein S1 [Candidatus Methylomirabilis oxygeniifera]|uniref:Small ribosomal subunit protein bS1 n=1 Tax=Methylomirabilis oxygeniifera TaxID=671143 RepID=D5MFA1_METO1|nr:MAG: 30S ribosomal protein S1 [Candidatus Methylomirabilis oxyfera]CBE68430.1 30S ribosomal subunit protein S1 [Candidatus Methylomirabilis oxyfera]